MKIFGLDYAVGFNAKQEEPSKPAVPTRPPAPKPVTSTVFLCSIRNRNCRLGYFRARR